MAFPLRDSANGPDALSPRRIARHQLFTPREKLGLLEELRVGVAGALAHDVDPGIKPDEIDDAIDEVRRTMERGGGKPAGEWKH
jgi:hypothetical protein